MSSDTGNVGLLREAAAHWDRIEAGLREYLTGRLPPGSARDMVAYQLDSGGKRIRPLLVMLVAETLCEDCSRMDPFAAAVEVIHNASLVHDDIQDGDETRRGVVTAWKRFGTAQAINLGDLLFTLGFDLIHETPHPPAFRLEVMSRVLNAYRALVCGQILELDLRDSGQHGEGEYLEVIRGKTAAMFSLSLAGAGVLSGASSGEIEALDELGHELGLLFQIRDDVIDVMGYKEGRDEGADIREGKVTLMSSRLLDCDLAASDRRRALEILNGPREDTTDADVGFVIDLYRRYGCIDYALERYAELTGSVQASMFMREHEGFRERMNELLELLDPQGL